VTIYYNVMYIKGRHSVNWNNIQVFLCTYFFRDFDYYSLHYTRLVK